MKILLRPRLCSAPLANALAAEPDLGRALGAEPNAAVGQVFKKFVDADGPHLPRILALAAAHGERLSFLRDLQFTGAELDAATHLQVVGRVTAGQSRPDADRTHAAYDAEALVPTASRWAVRLPRVVHLSKAPPPATIAHVDQWTGEYVLGREAASALRAGGLSGWELAPVPHPRTGAPVDGVEHLRTQALLPPVLWDRTTYETWDDGPGRPSQPRRRGLLPYPAGALDASPDFARTAEPWCDWRTPQWVVRQRVRAWFTAAGLRGWAFWPVLEAGTPLHAAHTAAWGRVLDRLEDAGAELL